MPKRLFYRLTDGIRITVTPSFLATQSRPTLGRFVFAYEVRIENVGTETVQLLSRRWLIHDGTTGEDQEVLGDGVVGEQPVIQPRGIYEYQSYCILKGPTGYMEGHYDFSRDKGERLRALIPRFELDATAEVDRA
ncbi:MAG: Co2+/Mg2+ efflux protein ApaG [Gemmatimonadota bacterium]